MKTVSMGHSLERKRLFKTASALALITIFYNIAEGLISVFFGIKDETVALFGFGLDSFIEVISGIGIWHMVRRLRANSDEHADQVNKFERTALRVTGSAFYLLTAGLALTAAVNFYMGSRPETTLWGIIISSVSIATMWALIRAKVDVGKKLGSDAILSDAACTRTCLYLSFVLLLASAGYELTGIGGMDSAGALAIAWISFREGREAFEKSNGIACSCGNENTCKRA